MCEDYPCCGHTDGFGCDWVSPNEIVPCDVCIEARASYPYHEGWAGSCPTIRKREQENIPANSECGFADENDPDCEGEACCRVTVGEGKNRKEMLSCASCARKIEEYYEEMRDQDLIYYSH